REAAARRGSRSKEACMTALLPGNLLRLAVLLLLALPAAGAAFGADAAPQKSRHYVCAPCGMPCDKAVYDKPGTCPACGARLVDQEAAKAAAARAASRTRKKVAILIFDGVEIIDYTGPWEVFGTADFDVYTVAETRAPVT